MGTRKEGFTIIETIIGLMIVCSLVAISVWNLKDYQARIEERQTLQWFKGKFKNAMNYAYLNHEDAKVIVDPGYLQISNGKFQVQKHLPKTLTITTGHQVFRISKSGETSPRTVIFQSTLTGKKYEYTIQMGWGEIVEKT
ncbi:type II secretion system protein [Companilactobacillus sp. HBUAS59544]|uniref:type II secretion system protein n=1 Tax=Companilactobacillus sp. HBUAS59544 TaxID=3109363 RepID=UPI002FF410CB